MKTSHRNQASHGIGLSRIAFIAVLALAGQACTLPQSAPMRSQVRHASSQGRVELTPVTAAAAAQSREPETASFPASLRSVHQLDPTRFYSGDGIDVVIWERDSLGVFVPTGPAGGAASGASDLGTFTVDEQGNIQLPFVGKLHVGGLTPDEAHSALQNKLNRLLTASDSRLSPTTQHGRLITVQGNVTKPGVYPIDPGMLRLSSALSLAAPLQSNPETTQVTIRRKGASFSVRLSDLNHDHTQDVALMPDDVIVVTPIAHFVTVLGAVGAQSRVLITQRNFSVLDALASARGASDATADIRAVYLLHFDPHAAIGAKPLIYEFNLRRPEEIALARQFSVHDGDTVFVSDAPFAQTRKVLTSLSSTLSSIRSIDTLSN